MKKYTISYKAEVSFDVDVFADSATEAKNLARMYASDGTAINVLADNFPRDLSDSDVKVGVIFNEDGDYVYDGIGNL